MTRRHCCRIARCDSHRFRIGPRLSGHGHLSLRRGNKPDCFSDFGYEDAALASCERKGESTAGVSTPRRKSSRSCGLAQALGKDFVRGVCSAALTRACLVNIIPGGAAEGGR
eukprot:scaffold759_cov119-Isochrysis_galbana.AAC.12